MDSRFTGELLPSPDDPELTEALLSVIAEGDSHAITLAELPTLDDNGKGDLLGAWFNGPGEGEPGTHVVVARLPQGSGGWEPPVLIASDPERSEQNPVLFVDPSGTVWLLHTSNEPHDQKSAHVVARTSDDLGRTWSSPWVLFKGPGFFLRNPPLFQSDGSWLLPAYYCTPEGEHSLVVISEDQGRSWTEYPVPDSLGRVQLTIAPRADGSLLGLFRSRQADRIYASESQDLGRTWSSPVRTALPNNNSAVQVTALTDGSLALIFNDATLERDQFRWVGEGDGLRKKALRTPLTVAISDDGGRTWPFSRNVQMADLEYRGNEMGYSYPAILQTSDGRLQIAYSFLRKTIKHVQLDPSWIRKGSDR